MTTRKGTPPTGSTLARLIAVGTCIFSLVVCEPASSQTSVPVANAGKIAFSSNRDGNHEIYVMNADGSDQTRLTYNHADDIAPNFSRDGSKIAFTSDRDGYKQIYVMNADGSGETQLTDSPEDSAFPSFSPDGSKITFISSYTYYDHVDNTPPGPPRHVTRSCEIYVMNSDGSNRTRLTHYQPPDQPHGVLNQTPTFNADGSKILFQSDGILVHVPSPPAGIFAMNVDGSDQTPLSAICSDIVPAASPDGRRIAFTSSSMNGFGIYIMDSDGSGRTRLSEDTARPILSLSDEDWSPSFSPDGSKIVFSRDNEIYMMNADGSGRTRLTQNSALDWMPSWAPAVSMTTTSNLTAQLMPAPHPGSDSAS